MKSPTFQDFGILILRIGIGIIVLFYGLQKLTTLFGGYGFTATLDFFHTKMGIPTLFATFCIFTEAFGSAAILIGLLTRLAAVALAINFGVATYFATNHFQLVPHILNGTAKPTDLPLLFYPMALCVASLALVLIGPGKISIDARIFRPRKAVKV